MSELLRILGELWAERARVGLVAIGVLWGTLALGLLLAFGRSLTEATTHTADSFGVDLLRVAASSTSRPFQGLPAGRPLGMRPDDVELLASVPGVRGVCHEYSSGGGFLVRAGGVRRNVPTAAVSPGFGSLRNHRPRPGGRFLTLRDHEERRRVCFLGYRVAARLFGEPNPVGRTLEWHGTPFTVVGVGPERITTGDYNGQDRDKLTMPSSTFRELAGWRWVNFGWVGLEPRVDRRVVERGVRAVLGARLRFDPEDENALDIFDYVAIREMVDEILVGNRVFTVVVGILGLLVSVVGVTNVMLALVEERTRELGVQLALGARPRALATERLTEGLLVTTLGGVAGLLLCGALLAALGLFELPPEVRAYLGNPRLDPGLGAGVLAILVAAGALAGWVPARRAMRLDPVEVLREE